MSNHGTGRIGFAPIPGRAPGRGPSSRFKTEKAEPKNTIKTLRRFRVYLKESRIKLLLIFLLILIVSMRDAITPWLISLAIDRYIIPGNPRGLLGLSLLMLGIFLVVAAAGWLQQRLTISVTQRTLESLRGKMFTHLQNLDLGYYDGHTHGEIMSRFTNDVENINNVMNQIISQFLSSIISLFSVGTMMIILSPILALITLTTVPLIFFITRIIGKVTRKNFRKRQRQLGEINGEIEEVITGIKEVRLFRRVGSFLDSLEKKNRVLKTVSLKAQIFAGFMGPSMNMLNNLRYGIIAAAGGLLHLNGVISLGTIAAFLNYTRQFGRPLNQIAHMYNSILSALAGAERVFDLLDQEPAVTSPAVSEGAPPLVLRGEVEFQNVFFSYLTSTPVLKNINLRASPGERVALVGPTGAGKTTLINLLTRFYDVKEGRVLIDGQNIKEYPLKELRRNLGLVLQDTFLFRGSVTENIRYGNLIATEEEVLEAAKTSRADHFIRHLPRGYSTILSEDGLNLSQGQRQLIAIARAVLADPAVLILDEATSSVDTRTEKLIQEGMLRLMEGRTAFIIAHRLSTVREAHRILVLNNGEIIEEGNHGDLLALRGFYSRLHTISTRMGTV